MRWTKGLLAPERLGLVATAGPAGARAARLLYHQRRHLTLAPAAGRARSFALTHGLGPRRLPPLEEFGELCDLLGLAPSGAAAIRSGTPGRQVICIVDGIGTVVVKVGRSDDAGLAAEAAMLTTLNGAAGSIATPRVIRHGPWRSRFIVATEGLDVPDVHTDVDREEAAEAATSLCRGASTAGPVVHGDLSPWNLIRTRGGLALVDWEEGRVAREPLFDLSHFLVTCGALLTQEPPARVVSRLIGKGSPGWLHLEAVGVDPASAPALLLDYLRRTRDYATTRDYRHAVLRALQTRSGRVPSPSDLTTGGAQPDSTAVIPQ